MWKYRHRLVIASMLLLLGAGLVHGEVEVEGWGDLRGFRIDGQLFPITTSVRIVGPGGRPSAGTGHWQQRDLHFALDGDKQIYDGKFGIRRNGQSVVYQTIIEPLDAHGAKIHVRAVPQQDMNLDGVYFSIGAPLADFSGAEAELIGVQEPTTRSSDISTTQPATGRHYLHGAATGVRLTAGHRRLEVEFDHLDDVVVRDVHDPKGDQVNLLVQLHSGGVKKDQIIEGSFTVAIDGDIDHQPAHLAIDAASRGAAFEGIGGNFVFRLDTPDVSYNLQHLRIVWARLAVPLTVWEPIEQANPDPRELAGNDQPKSDIRQSLELAKQLQERGIPLIFSLWVPPAWAVNNIVPGEPYAEGRRVRPEKWDELCNGIASYLLYAREHYGVEPKYFSLNETDIGVTIRLTPIEYAEAIKRIGACFVSKGISTKILLGDVSKPPPVDFIKPASADPEALKYVGAISFHSWNGATPEQLAAWHTAAQKLNLPLFVAEGGTDSDAYKYPHVFGYSWYAIDEAAMYLDVLSNSQPASILPWEMTPDYPLEDFQGTVARPSERFWCLKQLSASSVAGSTELQFTCDQPAIHAAALLDPSGDGCCIHLVNTGASRDISISGIPGGVGVMETYVTDQNRQFVQGDSVEVKEGVVEMRLPAMSFVTLIQNTGRKRPG
jgi:hypothetical protein